MLRFETAGESHGECLVATLTGLPAGVPVSLDSVNRELWRRQQGFGSLILRLLLPEAAKLGLKKVLITCEETNTASRKIIEANGGVFENAVTQRNRPAKMLRFWIDLREV